MIKKVKFLNGERIFIKVYDKLEHKITPSDLDEDAVRLVKKIKSLGGQGFIVGGAIRDLVLGKKPSDFDIATSLKPSELRRHFKNSRIIGKRFKLVLMMYKDKEIEVATFRSKDSLSYEAQSYGTIESDAFRRDFTINALYFDPLELKLYDFHNSFEDLKARRLVSVIDLKTTFHEDPVRMIRAVKYSVKNSLSMDKKLKNQISKDANLLEGVSKSRMAEEMIKILLSGVSLDIFTALDSFGLLKYILPIFAKRISDKKVREGIAEFDRKISSKNIKRDLGISLGISSILKNICDYSDVDIDLDKSIFTAIGKKEASPVLKKIKDDFNNLNFSNIIYYNALKIICKSRPSDSN